MIQTRHAAPSDELFQVWIKCTISARHINDSVAGAVDTCLEKFSLVGGEGGGLKGCKFSQESSGADTL